MATHSVFLPRVSHGQRSLAGYSLQGHQRVNTPEVTEHTCNIMIHISLYCKMITTITSVTTHSYNFLLFFVMRTLKIYSLSDFQVYNTVLFISTIMLYIMFPGLIYFITGSLVYLFFILVLYSLGSHYLLHYLPLFFSKLTSVPQTHVINMSQICLITEPQIKQFQQDYYG